MILAMIAQALSLSRYIMQACSIDRFHHVISAVMANAVVADGSLFIRDQATPSP